jgi:hypothetical protein
MFRPYFSDPTQDNSYDQSGSFWTHPGASFLGQEVTYNAEANSFVNTARGSTSSHHGGGGGGGSTTPSPTLVATSGSHLEFNLIWDSSVANLGSNEQAFMTAMVDVAKYYETLFTTTAKEVVNIQVGWGEIAGQSLPSGALGASESNGYLVNYSTVVSGLEKAGLPATAFTASNEPTTAEFFISSAEAKSFGLIPGTSSGVDGYIGFGTLSGTGYSWNFTSSATTGQGSGTLPTQFDFQGVAQHEISEVMGRIAMEGHTVYNGQPLYTPLDLFNFDSPGHLVLSGGDNSGSQVQSYFSVDNGATQLGWFNDGYKGGDIADWASYSSSYQSDTLASHSYQDAFDAFGYPGINSDLSTADGLVMQTLGLSPTGALIA